VIQEFSGPVNVFLCLPSFGQLCNRWSTVFVRSKL